MELLVVICIGAIIGTISVSTYSKLVGSGALTIGMQSFIGALDQARQTAIARNNYVEVRLYQLPASSTPTGTIVSYRAMQTFLVTTSGSYTPMSKVLVLPAPLIIQAANTSNETLNHSTLLDNTYDNSLTAFSGTTTGTWSYYSTLSGTTIYVTPAIVTPPSLPTYGTQYNAICFRFNPKGGLNLNASATISGSLTSLQWYITLVSSNDSVNSTTNLPNNFATIQIDGFTGKASYYRP